MGISHLSKDERNVVFECLLAASEGPFFPEWEFHTLFGIERARLKEILGSWPDIDESQEDVQLAIQNSMGNLVGYPHGKDGDWSKYISASPQEVLAILQKWKSSDV